MQNRKRVTLIVHLYTRLLLFKWCNIPNIS